MKIDNPFAGLTNPDDIRSAFKAAALRYHPDITGDDGEKFKLMLNMYHDANAWYWHNPTKRRTKYNSRLSLSDLADKYGSETVHGSTAVST